MSDWISLELRNFVRQRARGRCEYCQLHEDDAGLRHQPDHIVALKNCLTAVVSGRYHKPILG